MGNSTATRLPAFVIPAMAVYLIGLAWWSLRWHLYQDAPIMLYTAFLIDRKHLVPYRDFFDMNMPGAYAVNVLIGRWSNYAEPRIRIADLVLLSMLLGLTLAAMRRFGWRVAACAATFFGVLYIASGEWISLQRDFLLLIPIAASVAVVWWGRPSMSQRAGAAGLLIGLAATIKPQASLTLVVITIYLCVEAARRPYRSSRMAIVLAAIAGFLIPQAVMLWYLWRAGALPAFADMALHYWPLYTALSGTHPPFVVAGWFRWWYILSRAALLGVHPGLPLAGAASIGAAVALRRSRLSDESKRAVWMLAGLAGCSVGYAMVPGKFWRYHWLPFDYFAVLLGSVGLVPQRADPVRQRASVTGILLLLLIGLPWPVWPFAKPFRVPHEAVEEIAAYLSQHLHAGDGVLPLDWTEGADHAMLLAQAPPATPFIYDFHFYHHVSSPYIQQLRGRLMRSLAESPPRFIVQMKNGGTFVGPDTTDRFDDLYRFIAAGYDKVVDRAAYEIWERRFSSSHSG